MAAKARHQKTVCRCQACGPDRRQDRQSCGTDGKDRQNRRQKDVYKRQGVFYREFTKFSGFTGKTALYVVHTHYFLLGMVFFLLLLLLEKLSLIHI